MIEHAVNNEGQGQIINSLDKIVKIGDKYLQVRLIQTERWRDRSQLTPPMPRAKFVYPENDKRIHYMVERGHLIELIKNASRRKTKGR